jgi:lipopolysaccharide/colanic/teichoic acid biosynthesis glycosyltransferase
MRLESERARRALDVAVAISGVIVAAPVMALVALLVRLDSPGPAFFRQERVGRHGKIFRIHKFRTMTHGHIVGAPAVTASSDTRITRVGRWLRRSKVDELPQLIDVLRGDMSLVGPRPEVPRYIAYYTAEDRAVVLSVRPGITDPVSLLLHDEQALLSRVAAPEEYYRTVLLPAKLRVARRYVLNRSLGTDLAIIAQTVLAVLGHRPRVTQWGRIEDLAIPPESL